jgi:predicted site-specific integrase-resolvase
MTKVYDIPVADAADRAGVSPETMKRYARTGKVAAHKTISGKWMFNADDLDELSIHAVVVDA